MSEEPASRPQASGPSSQDTRCGHVAIAGRPNVGKSTLLNRLLGQKLAITSRKPQTTRRNLLGIDTQGACQAIYVDTPGIGHLDRLALNREMLGSALSALDQVDLILMLFDRDAITHADRRVMRQVARAKKPAFAVINKADLLKPKTRLLPAIARLDAARQFSEILPVSALRGDGVAELGAVVFEALPPGPHLFPPDQLTDQSERFLAGEVVREKLVRRLGDELPHRTAVLVERFDTSAEAKVVGMDALILVESRGQKRIVIGKGGERLKSIGQDARLDIERLLDRRVMLRLWVKVRRAWSNDPAALRELDLTPGA